MLNNVKCICPYLNPTRKEVEDFLNSNTNAAHYYEKTDDNPYLYDYTQPEPELFREIELDEPADHID